MYWGFSGYNTENTSMKVFFFRDVKLILSLWTFVKVKPKVSSLVKRKRRCSEWPRSVPAARCKGGSVSSVAWQPQSLRLEEMSKLTLCIKPHESSH